MRRSLALLSALTLTLFASAVYSQENTEAATSGETAEATNGSETAQAEAPTQQTRASTPQEVTRAVHGSWQIRCVTTEPQQCYLYQLIVNEQNAPLIEYSMIPARDETGGDVRMAATMITPLNTVLERGIIMQVDERDPIQKPYNWCAPIGCFARFGMTGAELDVYRAGTKLTTVLFMMQNPQQGIEIDMPLDGFGDAYDELLEIEAEIEADAADAG